MKLICIAILLSVILSACNGQEDNSRKKKEEQPGIQTSVDIVPLLNEVDSLDVLFFSDPYGDSLRYTRFYSYTFTSDSSTINTVRQQMNLPVNFRQTMDTCRSEGKMFLFSKNEPVKTIYFALRSQECNHLYFIKDGNYYYVKPGKEMEQILSKLRQQAKKDQ